MKRLLFLLFISSNFAIAQQARDTLFLKYDRELFQILRKQQLSNDAVDLKPTGLKQRVIAQSLTNSINTDSTAFKYSGMRGSRFDFNGYYYDPVLDNALEPDAFSILADSITSVQNDTIRYLDYAYYRPDNKTDSIFSIFFDEIYSLDSTKIINLYNANGIAYRSYYFSYDPVTNDTATILQYSYDITQTKKLTDSVWAKESGNWFLGSVTQYHYNTLGQLDTVTSLGNLSGSLVMTNQGVYTYYPDGKLRTRFGITYFDDPYFTSTLDTFGYTPGIEYCTMSQSIRTTDFGAGTEVLYSQVLKYPGVNGTPDSTVAFRKNAPSANWTRTGVYKYTCNSYNNPEEILYFKSSNTSGTPNTKYRFYYELYNDGLAIDEDINNIDLVVYPNPFSNQIDVDCKSLLNQNCTFRLLNVAGINVFSVRKTNKGGKASFSLPQLPIGFYTLQIQSPDGHLINKKMIRK